MRKYLIHSVVAALAFVVVLGIARSTPALAAPTYDFFEECDQEGCSNHEVEELWESFEHECIVEGCSQEEVRELAGRTDRIDRMYVAFCNLGHNFTWLYSSRTNCAGTTGRALDIRRHTTSSLSTRDADRIVSAATNVVGTSNGSGDVACRVTFFRQSGVGTFTTGDGSIDSQAEFNAVIGTPGYVKVVNQINWCGGFAPNIIGCAPVPGNSLAVVRITGSQEGILWAHEYGHTKGLGHRNASNAVMNPTISSSRTFVTNAECTAYRN